MGKEANVDPREYQLEFFRRNGFMRKKCSRGGEYFWTLNPEQDHCNDAPCVEYYFWKVPKKVRGLSVAEARRRFIDFFRRNGHEPLEPRPVVARWRNDLYLTIASIVVFQPHVTSGLVPPPANPLVIVQPSIRLEDIDNVGVTLGRHLTSFEMGGHHAFNYPGKEVYWKERTVELAFRFFTEEIGIPPDQITFKESWWEGGGNAGPSFEVTVGGLELATLVFMQYRVVDGRYEPMPLRVVDTGYGIERIAWFTQDVPTAFHAIYGSLLDEFRKILGVEPAPENLLWAAARDAGRLDPEDPRSLEAFYRRAAEDAGLPLEEAKQLLQREAAVYAVLDHSKTIALMLADGIVPSNTGEGYLARLVIRRALRVINRLGSDADLVELVRRQAEFWGRDYYPRMLENLDYITKVTRIEVNRYYRSLQRGLREVEKLLRRKKTLSLDDLILLYDSHGIPPDMVAEAAAKLGARVEVPHNFYAIVAERHGARGAVARTVEDKTGLPSDIVRWAEGFPETRRLFHEDPYMRRFEAKILGANGSFLVLDQTAFYPTGGGQLHDTGKLTACGKEWRVTRVEKTPRNVIVHVLDKPVPSECVGEKAVGEIDWQRRYRLMRHHTGVHVLLGAARRVLGNHVWQAGAEKTPEKARLDITHYELPSREEVRRIEELANKAILERIPVEAQLMDRNEAEKLYGFRLYQGGVPMSPVIRVLRIGDWDIEACFGTHLANTGEIGSIKIINVEKLQDGVVRFEIVAGSEVARYATSLEEKLDKIASMIKASRSDADKRLEKLLEEHSSLKKRLAELRRQLAEQMLAAAKGTARSIDGLRIYIIDASSDPEAGREAMKQLSTGSEPAVVVMTYRRGNGTVVEVAATPAAAKQLDLRRLAKQLAPKGLRGGGKPTHITLYTRDMKPQEAVEKLLEELARATGS